MKYIKWFSDVNMADVSSVGGKNASLGQMISQLTQQGLRVPNGFAVTAEGYWHFINSNHLPEPIKKLMNQLTEIQDLKKLRQIGQSVRSLIVGGTMPEDMKKEIVAAYHLLSKEYDQKETDVAVRSSATAEDLPTASFAGQQETYLNVRGDNHLIEACKKSMASLFTDRAIVYRTEKGFDHFKVALSVGVQKMIRADIGVAGVIFSVDTETGFKDVVMIESSFGLGESIVKGLVTPDEFVVFQKTLEQGFEPIIKKKIGQKDQKLIYKDDPKEPTEIVPTTKEEQDSFSLSDQEILELARATTIIEKHYSEINNRWMPMDIEWAKDGIDKKLYILQARPETIHGIKEEKNILYRFELQAKEKPTVLLMGQSIGQQIISGPVRVIQSADFIDQVQKGDILVTDMTDPDWVPAMKRAAGIITNRGGRTCHAAIVSRELGVPAIVGAQGATKILHDEQIITLDCSQGMDGFIYEGAIPFKVISIELKELPKLPIELLVNLADPDRAFTVSQLPVDGVGLARVEFIFSNDIKVHPMALLQPEKIKDQKIKEKINYISRAYPSKEDFFIQTLAQGVGTIAAAFYPKPVIVRLSDFKTNEYGNLLGGQYFEPKEENPMLGFRGASRYYHPLYKDAFVLECSALKLVRDKMGLVNMQIMVPFVRTVNQAKQVGELMAQHGLKRGENGLKLIMMCEVPSNVLLMDKFAQYFDGFSIGSNDLTQLTLGVDRDSQLLAKQFDERDEAVKLMLEMAVESAKKLGKYIGICGQAPSDFPELAQFLIDLKIDSISLNADSVLPFLFWYKKKS